jgi:hypothetical protein
VLRSLQEFLVPLKARLRPRLVKLLKTRLGLGPSPALDRLKREAATLERKIDGGLERLVLLSGNAAERLAEKVQAWTKRKAAVAAALGNAEEKRRHVSDVEAMADEVLELLDDLAATALDAPVNERRVLFRRAVRGVELEFESVPPKTGKRMRRKLRKAQVALSEALVLAASVLPQRRSLVTNRPPGYVVRLEPEDLCGAA